jgi:myosin heavy subunit
LVSAANNSAVSVETIDDRAEFAALVQAMRTVGLSAEEQVR